MDSKMEDSIKILDSTSSPEEEMSYLFGRDPSILAYSQRPIPSQKTKMNLLSIYEDEEFDSKKESLTSSNPQLQTVKVYLRLKPFPKKIKLTEEQQEVYKITSSTNLITKLPVLDKNQSYVKRSTSTDFVCRKFTFTKTFGPETTQLQLFEDAVKQQMVDFLAGQNSTIMTYGTTNSGKSYTLQGTTTSPGIIPRCLEFVFSNITPKSTPSYKPVHHCDVICLDPLERAQELEIKAKLLTFTSVDKHQYITSYKEMQNLLREESPIRPSQCNDAHYSVWVSFAEIYNEIVYDLLSNHCHKKRTPLKLATDSQGRAFIKGLKSVCVNSGSEAYQILMAGQYNLKVAATALNARSSRSHCIFTIQLLKYYMENNSSSVEVSTFAFCDLAGTERLKKTLNIGERLKEAQNINTSLLVLGRCLKTIHEGQLTKQKIEHVGPFRESKLTRLFQKALSGKEHIALIVNINPAPNLYIETQNVLNFSAIAKKIVIEQSLKSRKISNSRFSRIVSQSIKTATNWDTMELESEEWAQTTNDSEALETFQQTDYEDLVTENESLRKELASVKGSMLARDLEIRQEMADTYTAMMKKLEEDWRNRVKDVEEQQDEALQWSVKEVEDYYKQKLDQLSMRKKRPRTSDMSNDYSKDLEDLEEENSRLTTRIVMLKSNKKDLKETNQALIVEKNKVLFELNLAKDEVKNMKSVVEAINRDDDDPDRKQYIEELEAQLSAKQEQVKNLKVFLEEAKQEYISITDEIQDKEEQLKLQEETLVENEDKIEELETHLEHANICIAERNSTIEILEEKLERKSQKIDEHKSSIEDMQARINKLESEKLTLKYEVLLLKKSAPTGHGASEPKTEEITCAPLENQVVDVKVDGPIEVEEGLLINLEEDISKEDFKLEKESDLVVKEKEDKLQTVATENKVENKSSQTVTKETKEQIIQTSILEEKDESTLVNGAAELVVKYDDLKITCEEKNIIINALDTESNALKEDLLTLKIQIESYKEQIDEGTKLKEKYDEMKTSYAEKSLAMKVLEEELSTLKFKVRALIEENMETQDLVKEYKQSVELLQNELVLIKTDKIQADELLQCSESLKIELEEKIATYEQRFNETEKEYNQCAEKLKSAENELSSHLSKCKSEFEETINNLRQELLAANEKNDIKTKCLNVHACKINELELDLENVPELQRRIDDLNKHLEDCKIEKDRLQTLLNDNNEKLLDLEDRLLQAEEKEREKEAEIISLQKGMKCMIQSCDRSNDQSDKLMEKEMKNTIRDLTETKEILAKKELEIEHLEVRLKSYDQNTKILDLLQQSAKDRQMEMERLQSINEEMKTSLLEKEHEMISFMKNRDEMVAKYESLVKSQQEELEKQKQETTKARRPKEKCENTSEDEASLKERRGKRPARKCVKPLKSNEVPVVDISSSDSKRNARRKALPPPESVEPQKRNNRRKKLFVNESYEEPKEIEPIEDSEAMKDWATFRSLRSRRK